MTRLIVAMLTVLIALTSINLVSANETTVHDLFIADYHGGVYYGAVKLENGFIPVKFSASNQTTYEDMLPASNVTITATLDSATNTFTVYSTEYQKTITFEYSILSEVVHISDLDNSSSILTGKLDGVAVQFAFQENIVENGAAVMIERADPNSIDGLGYMVQNGLIVSYAAYDGVPVYTINLPMIFN